jgi:KDEL-tailed cysteine endopeptidase
MNFNTFSFFLLFVTFSKTIAFNVTWGQYLKRFPNVNINALSEFHFGNNVKWIIEQNSMNHSYKLGLTPFLHLSDLEWKSRFHNITLDKPENIKSHVSSLRGVPTSWNWVTEGMTTPVKDQQNCGSCYSFSATETVETTYAIKTGKLLVLSPQQVVDCSKLNSGCNGGLQSRVYKYLEKTSQCLDSDYPYTAKDGTCQKCTGGIPLLNTYVSVEANETEMANALLITSLAVAIEADEKQFQVYTSGVLDFDCGTNLDHAVTIEGMGTEDGKDYWLVRNSWSADWGEQGYIKMARGKNLCGIANSVVYPKF